MKNKSVNTLPMSVSATQGGGKGVSQDAGSALSNPALAERHQAPKEGVRHVDSALASLLSETLFWLGRSRNEWATNELQDVLDHLEELKRHYEELLDC